MYVFKWVALLVLCSAALLDAQSQSAPTGAWANSLKKATTDFLFSDPVQKMVATMHRFAYLNKETSPGKKQLFFGSCVFGPLALQLAHNLRLAQLAPNNTSLPPIGLLVGTIGTAYAWACLGSTIYTEHAINLLKQKIKDKQHLTPFEVQQAIDLSLYYFAYQRKKTTHYDYLKYNFYDQAVWDHPQLNTNPTFIQQCIKAFKHSLSFNLCPTDPDIATAIIRAYPTLSKKYIKKIRQRDGSFFLHNYPFYDLLVKDYIQHYMQPAELNQIIYAVAGNSGFPYSTEALKPYITAERSVIFVDSGRTHTDSLLWDYIYVTYLQHYAQSANHPLILQRILGAEGFPQTLKFYAQEPYLSILITFMQTFDHITIRAADELLTAIPALHDELKKVCHKALPSYYFSHCDFTKVHHKEFFKEIIQHQAQHDNTVMRTLPRKVIRFVNNPTFRQEWQTALNERMDPLILQEGHALTSPTKRYIEQYPHRVLEKFGQDLGNTALQHLSREIITLESQEEQKGHFTFLHGEPKEMHALQYWFTKLYEIKYHVTVGDYIFTRFLNETGLLNQVYHWGTRLQNGYRGNRTDVFMGHCLYSNRAGACAGDYYLRNRAIYNFHETLKQIFKKFGYSTLYENYKKELNALAKEYRSICPYGQVLLFSFSKNALRKSVYAAYGGGRRRSVTIKKRDTSITTPDIVTIARAMRDNLKSVQDYENLEFCFIPTIDYGLHPDIAGKEIRVFNVTGADPEKMKAYQAKEHALFEKIKADIRARENTRPSFIHRMQQAAHVSVFKNNNKNSALENAHA